MVMMGDKRTLELLRAAHKASGGYGWKHRKAEALAIQSGNRVILNQRWERMKARDEAVRAYLKDHKGALFVPIDTMEGVSKMAILIADKRLKGETFQEIGDMLGVTRQAVHANFHKTLKHLDLVNDGRQKQ